jgi:hypothetical protein
LLDQILIDNPGRVVAVEWHISSSYPLYCAEGEAKWYLYPPPYGGYATPWIWIDGRQRGYDYSQWTGYVAQRRAVPTDVMINLTGSYNSGIRTGQIIIEFYNGSDSIINAAAQVVVVEDSCYFLGPNGDGWHNHVCRDYVPDPHGTPISLQPGVYDTLIRRFTIDSNWNATRCKIVVYLQNMTIQADSSMPVYQGAETKVVQLTGIDEKSSIKIQPVKVSVNPNPCRENVRFNLADISGESYRLSIYRIDGSLVREFKGTNSNLNWNLTDKQGRKLQAGVYHYRLQTANRSTSGKIIISN